MGPFDLLQSLVTVLDRLQIDYLVTGSVATIIHGEPRFTNDVDVLVELPETKLSAFLAAFPSPEYYCSAATAQDAIRRKKQFNLIHTTSGFKVDVIIPAKNAFNDSRLARGRVIAVTPVLRARIASPEDVILKKLEYFREGGSEKHLRDISGVLKVRQAQLDIPYLEHWVKQLDLQTEWNLVKPTRN